MEQLTEPIAENEKIHDPDLERHLRELGLNSIAEYQAWCVRNGYSPRVDKHWRDRCRERFLTARDSINSRSKRRRDEQRNPRRIIQQIFAGQVQADDLTLPQFQLIYTTASGTIDDHTRHAFQRLLLHAVDRTALIDSQGVTPQLGLQPGNTFIGALLALAGHAKDWIRGPEDWRPQSHNARRQFASLTRHLLARYAVPGFLDSVWFKGGADDAMRQQAWYKAIGNGVSVRELDLPIPLTRRMAHHFLQAPDDCSLESALRRGQVLGMGGGVRLARAILASRIGTSFQENEFWITVIRWFIQNPMFDPAQIAPAIDYIHHERLQSMEVDCPAAAANELAASRLEFSMKGRTPAALLQRMREWHAGLRQDPSKPQLQFRPSGINPFDWTEGSLVARNLRRWTIVELRSRKELYEEGRAMRHCVASYDNSCAVGGTSIWSLCLERNHGRRMRVLTLELCNRSKQICQVRGKANRLPSGREMDVVRRWADQEGLLIRTLI